MPISHLVALVIACDTACPATPARIQAMLREADAIWRPLGVALVRATPAPAAAPVAAAVLRVDLVSGGVRPTRGDADRLGSIVFDGDNVPASEVVVHIDTVTAIVGAARWGGRPLSAWPKGVADAVVARALGRVLAHEIGHYLLGLRTHRPGGLMRASFNASQLADPGRGPFTVGAGDVPRLRMRLAGLANGVPAVAAAASTGFGASTP